MYDSNSNMLLEKKTSYTTIYIFIKEDFACDECRFVGNSQSMLQLHSLVAHSNSPESSRCWQCPRCSDGELQVKTKIILILIRLNSCFFKVAR